MKQTLQICISPCPNDTFAFAGLLEQQSDDHGLALEIELLDVEQSNERLARGEFDAAKASFHAALRLSDDLALLSAGSALGYGVGPLLLRRPGAPPLCPGARVLCPGAWTTATMLYQLFYGAPPAEQLLFSKIMPALEAGLADYGVCIHEGRFTFKERGLELVEDLGARWETAFGCALPLGGILFRKRHGEALALRLTKAIEASIAWARAQPERALAIMRRHAQELSDEVLWAHVDLYVNSDTLCLSGAARAALGKLSSEAQRINLVPRSSAPLEVWGRQEPLRLFHLLGFEDSVELMQRKGTLRPFSLADQGFVHLSFASQLKETAVTHFARRTDLVLLELDASRLGTDLRYESSRKGELFPHLRRELRREDVLARWDLKGAPGAWDLPVG